MNAFLKTVRYMDSWVGRILNYLEEAGIADRTLVVVVGDQSVPLSYTSFLGNVLMCDSGQAFDEDDGLQGTFGNPHISNFRVPLSAILICHTSISKRTLRRA